MNKKVLIPILIVLTLAVIGFATWYFFLQPAPSTGEPTDTSPTGFVPFGNAPTGSTGNPQTNNPTQLNPDGSVATTTGSVATPVPVLRLLSTTPVGGFGVNTTATTTIIRWVDRGRGNIFETSGVTNTITTISNTVVPKIYRSLWNKNLTAFISSMMSSGTDVKTVYTEIRPQSPVTASTTPNGLERTPYELKGRNLSANTVGYALSPKKDKLFMFTNENNRGMGYISTFDNKNITRIFDTPVTQIQVEWPEENIITVVTNSSGAQNGFLYFVNPKTGVWKKILGPVLGLGARVSHDGKYALISFRETNGSIATRIYNISTGNVTDAVIRTLADKCVWGNFHKHMVYCSVPTQRPTALYPDAWYKGTVSFTDALWQVNVQTGDISMATSLLETANRVIDGFNLMLDDKDEFLFFMNKSDLSLWSLDLVGSN